MLAWKKRETGKEKMIKIKARTVFAFMFYAVFFYLVITEKKLPQELVMIVGTILGFYFGNKKGVNHDQIRKDAPK